jgi:hypothetical protein
MQVLEKDIEKAFVDALRPMGLIVLKFNLQGNTGWPDRLIIGPDGKTVWVELKRPGEEPTKLQRYRHSQLRERNHEVGVFDDAKKAAAYVIKKMDT